MTKHTPGPWIVTRGFDSDHAAGYARLVQTAEELEHVAHVCDLSENFDEVLANARLIAAAPELLEALRECITDENANALANPTAAGMLRRLHAITDTARAAIAKAEGAQ